MARHFACSLALATLTACGSEDSPSKRPPGGDPPSTDAGPVCGDGETVAEGGGCQPAGVAPDHCASGFQAADHGCTSILPDSPCPPGKMAVPGEATCHEVAACADGTYGDIPVEADTEYVDASYTGGASSGTEKDPWTSIQDAVDAAAQGAIVAIAAGSYAGDVSIFSKTVRLWGRCPGLVEVVGSGAKPGAIAIGNGASGTEVRSLAVINHGTGLVISSAKNVVLDALWFHDTYGPAVAAVDDIGSPSLTLRGALVEGTTYTAVLAQGAALDVEASVIRDTKPMLDDLGLGLRVLYGMHTSRSTLTLRTSLIERVFEFGLQILASDAVVESTVIRETRPSVASAFYGRGIEIQGHPTKADTSSVTIRQSVIERNRDAGIALEGSNAEIEDTVVRDTDSDASNQTSGRGVVVQPDPPGHPAALSLRSSLIERNRDVGVFVSGAQATLESVLIRDTQVDAADQTGGRGIDIQSHPSTGVRGTAAIRACVVERNREVGIFGIGSDVDIDSTWVRDVVSSVGSIGGHGILAQHDPLTNQRTKLTFTGSVVERCRTLGLGVYDSDATLQGSFVRDTAPTEADGSAGDGVGVLGESTSGATITAIDTRIESSARAGISNWSGTVSVEGVSLECNPIPLNGETFTAPYSFSDKGRNRCGCSGVAAVCKVLSSSLAAPPELPP